MTEQTNKQWEGRDPYTLARRAVNALQECENKLRTARIIGKNNDVAKYHAKVEKYSRMVEDSLDILDGSQRDEIENLFAQTRATRATTTLNLLQRRER